MTDELQQVPNPETAQAVMAELERLSEIADSQRQAGDVAALVETQATIIKLDTELLCCAQRMGEMQHEALQRAEAERDAALAEVTKLLAALPKWRLFDDIWQLGFSEDPDTVSICGSVSFISDDSDESENRWHWDEGGFLQLYPSRDSAMRAAEAAFGLPECEVVE